MTETPSLVRCLALAALVLTLCAPATVRAGSSGAVVTVMIDGVRSAGGRVTGSLCNESPTVFCSTYVARTQAVAGRTQLRFTGVAPGQYALSTVHDEDGDGKTEIPPEGFALGNNAVAPTFEATSIRVQGDMTLSLTMTYPGGSGSRLGSKGVEPPQGVVRIDMRDGGLYGELYAPQGASGPLPAVILIDGSSPGLDGISVIASRFAQSGFAALALAYFGEQGLPPNLEGVPLEYFDTALAALEARPDVDAGRIGVFGVSRGSEPAFMLAIRHPEVRAVAAAGPSSVLWSGYNPADPANSGAAWTLGGQPAPFLSPDLSLYDPDGPRPPMFTSALGKAGGRSDAIIPVERINGPILMISGQEDQIWPSPEMAHDIEARLLANGFGHDVENIVIAGANHYILANGDAALVRFEAFFRHALSL